MDEYILKIVVVGNMSVGKTALLVRYTDNEFTESHQTTIGVDFKVKDLQMRECHATMQLWDTAGQERFRTIVAAFYRGVEGLIIVFDVTNKESFEKVEQWLDDASQHANEHFIKLLVGNKIDLVDKRVVDQQTAQALADKLGMQYFETSAKQSSNVHEAFNAMAESIIRDKRKLGLTRITGWKTDKIKIQSTEVSEATTWCSTGYCY